MAKFKTGPVGRISTGHVLDVSKGPLERMLKDYDSQLYLKWNSKKLNGWGVWEVRRRPTVKTVTDIVDYKGMSFVVVDYAENDVECHVMNVAYLNYDILTQLKERDLWNQNLTYLVDNLESEERTIEAREKAKIHAEMRYHIKQEKSQIREYREAIRSGMNPAEIAKYWT